VLHVRKGNRVLLLLLVNALGIGFLLAMGCALNPEEDPNGNSNTNTNGNGVDPTLNRKTTTNLLEEWVQDAYSKMDSVKYEQALDESYQFQLLPEDVDPDNPDVDWWDKTTELIIAGNMFNARFNEDGQSVTSIDLSIDEKLNVVDNDNYAEKPPGETWYKVTTSVDLQVIVDNPLDQDGFTNYVVLSEQIFVCRPDPDADSLWVIFRQKDQPFIN